MTAILAQLPDISTVSEAPLDDAPAAVALSAALNVCGADLVTSSGQMLEQFWRDGKVHPWLLAGVKRAVGRLSEAVAEFEKETG